MNPAWKKARIATAVYLAPLLVAGQLSGSTLQEQNKAIAKQAFEEILSRGRFELADQLYAKDFVNHSEPLTNLLQVMQHLMSHNGHLKTAIIP